MLLLFPRSKLTGEKDRQIARMLTALTAVSCVAFFAVFLLGIYFHNRSMVVVTLAGAALQFVPFLLLRQGKLVAGGWAFSLLVLVTLTLLATFGQGYRDAALYAFPLLLIFTSMTLNRTVLAINLGLMLVAVGWLALGQRYGWFVPTAPSTSHIANFVLLAIILLAAAVAVDLLTTNTRRNLEQAQKELADRVRADAALRANEEKLRTIFETMGEGLALNECVFDEHGVMVDYRVVEVNKAFSGIADFRPGQVVGSVASELYGMSHEVITSFWETHRTRTTVAQTEFVSPISGKCFLISTSPFLNNRFVTSFIDITEPKRAQDTLHESEEKYHSLYRDAAIGIFHSTFDGRFIDVNPAMAKLLGYDSPEEVIGGITDIAAQVYAEPPKRDTIRDAALKAGGRVTTRARYRRKDGTMWDGLLHLRIVSDPHGKPSHNEGFVEDITERVRAEEALQQSEERYRQLFDASPDGIVLIGTDGCIARANAAQARMYSYGSPDDMIGVHATLLVAPSCREFSAQIMRRRLSGEDIAPVEYEVVRRDGSVFSAEVSAAILRSPDGAVAGYICITRDIAERRRMEEELQRTQKLESLGVLAGGLAHDFNNLLGGIYGYLEMAHESTQDETLIRYISKATKTMERARGLTMQLLTFAKGGAPIMEHGSLVPFVQETASFALSGSNISCVYSIPEDLWTCKFDRNQIGQVIDNIVINAKQAMPDGGSIALTIRNRTIAERQHPSLAPGQYVEIAVRDTGIGIPREVLPRIFDPFYTTKAAGHGLGLATCYSIVKRHGGCIDVESEPGTGSTFHVFLPASNDEVSAKTTQTHALHRGSGTILVMDDEEVIRDTTRDMLESLGYNVVCAADGREALGVVSAELSVHARLTALIFDVTIPGGMGGKEAIAEVRKMGVDAPAFVASGYTEDPVMAAPQEYGFTASIAKPFKKSELSELLNRFLGTLGGSGGAEPTAA
jgi:PAS domain S-box-containing protein